MSIKESRLSPWVLVRGLAHAKITANQRSIKLLSPSAESVTVKSPANNIISNALLLPAIKALNQPVSVITDSGI